MAYEFRAIGPEEVGAFVGLMHAAFGREGHAGERELWDLRLEPERTRVAVDDGRIVATSGLFSMRLAVPGAVVPMAGVTAVGVDPVHRRRGLLDGMMRGLLEEIRERGEEAVSALWASEASIYGRWGFGSATRIGELTVRSREAVLTRPPEGRPRAGAPPELLPELRAIYDALPRRPGMLERDDGGWGETLLDPEEDREGAGKLQAIVCDGGYALFAIRKHHTDGRADDVVELRELLAADHAAAAILWDHLLRLSLTRTVHWWAAPEDVELAHMVGDQRALTLRVDDALYLRLVDVPRALAERTYLAPVDVVLEVADPVCPWNAGRWRLAGGPDGATCERTRDPADLELSATELGAAHLGGPSLALLAAAGRVIERRRGALAAASHALRDEREPYAFELF